MSRTGGAQELHTQAVAPETLARAASKAAKHKKVVIDLRSKVIISTVFFRVGFVQLAGKERSLLHAISGHHQKRN